MREVYLGAFPARLRRTSGVIGRGRLRAEQDEQCDSVCATDSSWVSEESAWYRGTHASPPPRKETTRPPHHPPSSAATPVPRATGSNARTLQRKRRSRSWSAHK